MGVSFAWISRDQNIEVDEVARSASSDDQVKTVDWRLEEQNSLNNEEFQIFPVHTRTSWTSPILSYLKDGRSPPNPNEARKIKKWPAKFTMLNDELYKRAFS